MSIENQADLKRGRSDGESHIAHYLVRSEIFPIYETTSRLFFVAGLGLYPIKKSEEQIDERGMPLETPDIMRVDEIGDRKWGYFHELAGDVEYYLERNKIEQPNADPQALLVSAVKQVIKHETYRREHPAAVKRTA